MPPDTYYRPREFFDKPQRFRIREKLQETLVAAATNATSQPARVNRLHADGNERWKKARNQNRVQQKDNLHQETMA